jgi:hypothetical protein
LIEACDDLDKNNNMIYGCGFLWHIWFLAPSWI